MTEGWWTADWFPDSSDNSASWFVNDWFPEYGVPEPSETSSESLMMGLSLVLSLFENIFRVR